ncbi:MAG TPA: DNA repair protein RadC [Fimbriimonas sp.]|nr:DNA repair protein RadC [Fimbriimonas sp.]
MTSHAENPIQRVRGAGVRASSPIDLIAIGLARSFEDAAENEPTARRLLTRYRSLKGFGEAAPAELATMTGLDDFEMLRNQALIEIGRRIAQLGPGHKATVDDPDDVVAEIVEYLDHVRSEKREHFFAVLLDSKNHILKVEPIHIGTLNMSLVGPREVFRAAVREGASSLIVAHNHPSGDPTPSPEDIDVTKRLVDIGLLLDIPVLDHVIVGDPGYVSLHRLRYM